VVLLSFPTPLLSPFLSPLIINHNEGREEIGGSVGRIERSVHSLLHCTRALALALTFGLVLAVFVSDKMDRTDIPLAPHSLPVVAHL
jgi:hypothetical protein